MGGALVVFLVVHGAAARPRLAQSFIYGPAKQARVHNVVWDPTTTELVVFSNDGFGTAGNQSSILRLSGVGAASDNLTFSAIDLPCAGSEKWGGVRPVDEKQYWVSCGSSLKPTDRFEAPAGLFLFDGAAVTARLDGVGVFPGAAYDPFATWTDAADVSWQLFVKADDRFQGRRASVTACAEKHCEQVVLNATPSAAQLSARVTNGQLLVLAVPEAVHYANYTGGCCAEELLIYDLGSAADGTPTTTANSTVALSPIVPSDPSIKVSHTFFSWTEQGATVFNFAATAPGGGGDYVVEATLVRAADGSSTCRYVGHFKVPDSKHINGLTRFVHGGRGYTATSDLDFGVRVFADED